MKKIKNYLAFIIILISIYLIFRVKLPYYIEGPGGLININDRYEIDNDKQIKGSLNMTYVSEYDATIPFYIYAKINKDYDILKKKDVIPSNESQKEVDFRGKIMLKESSDNAIINAYKKAGKTCNILSQSIVIIYKDENSKTNLAVGDTIVSVDNINIDNIEDARTILKKHQVGDKIIFKTKNNEEKYGYVRKDNKIGVMFAYDRKLQTDPIIKINYEEDEYGPSGGLMSSLAIYNKLVDEDITKGYIISGTGTMEEDGSVGAIDGVKYKLKGAIKNKADIFLVPKDNYNEAIKIKKKNNYKIEIVKIETLDDAINYLKKIKEK